MPRGYNQSETSVHFMGYHFVWCPKYGKKVLTGKVEERLKQLINAKAKTMGCEILALEIMPDHVHLFIQGNPIMTPNKLIGSIKGFTSHELRQEFKELRTRLPTLWSRSYFVSTHGHVSEATIRRYIDEQRGM